MNLSQQSKTVVNKVFVLLIVFLGVIVVWRFYNNGKQPVASSVINNNNLESFFTDKQNYLDAFSKFTDVKKVSVYAVITSHHFLAKDMIAQTLSGVDQTNIERVIIVGPDHYQQITDKDNIAITTSSAWNTPFGDMPADKQTIETLIRFNKAILGTNAFRTEHSVYTLVPFVKYIFPKAKIIPLILKNSVNYSEFFHVGKFLSNKIDPDRSLLIISSDFSHQVTTTTAQENDKKSIEIIKTRKLENIDGIENDCRECIALLFGYLENKNTHFELVSNTNSFEISKSNPDNVTSYIGAYFIRD